MKSTNEMILGIVCHKAFWFDGKVYYTSNAFGKYIDELASHFKHIILVVPVSYGRSETHQDSLSKENVSFFPLPYIQEGPGLSRKLKLLTRMPKIWKLLKQSIIKCDIVHPRVPGHIGVMGFFAGLLAPKPMFTSVVGDWGTRIIVTRSSTIRRVVAYMHDYIVKYMCHHSIAFIQGIALQHKYGSQSCQLHQFISSSLSDQDICERVRDYRIKHDYCHILYVGNLSKEKGLLYLLNAVKILSDKGVTVQLHLVGEGAIRADIIKISHEFGIESKIFLHGYVPWGTKLFEYYQNADIFVLPSLTEGTPKVLLESMANGIPIIATNVGGIPNVASHRQNSILIPPGSAESIATAINELIQDDNLRNLLSINGLETAKQHTIKNEVARMIKIINSELYLKAR